MSAVSNLDLELHFDQGVDLFADWNLTFEALPASLNANMIGNTHISSTFVSTVSPPGSTPALAVNATIDGHLNGALAWSTVGFTMQPTAPVGPPDWDQLDQLHNSYWFKFYLQTGDILTVGDDPSGARLDTIQVLYTGPADATADQLVYRTIGDDEAGNMRPSTTVTATESGWWYVAKATYQFYDPSIAYGTMVFTVSSSVPVSVSLNANAIGNTELRATFGSVPAVIDSGNMVGIFSIGSSMLGGDFDLATIGPIPGLVPESQNMVGIFSIGSSMLGGDFGTPAPASGASWSFVITGGTAISSNLSLSIGSVLSAVITGSTGLTVVLTKPAVIVILLAHGQVLSEAAVAPHPSYQVAPQQVLARTPFYV